jgi:hypothetical protein
MIPVYAYQIGKNAPISSPTPNNYLPNFRPPLDRLILSSLSMRVYTPISLCLGVCYVGDRAQKPARQGPRLIHVSLGA